MTAILPEHSATGDPRLELPLQFVDLGIGVIKISSASIGHTY